MGCVEGTLCNPGKRRKTVDDYGSHYAVYDQRQKAERKTLQPSTPKVEDTLEQEAEAKAAKDAKEKQTDNDAEAANVAAEGRIVGAKAAIPLEFTIAEDAESKEKATKDAQEKLTGKDAEAARVAAEVKSGDAKAASPFEPLEATTAKAQQVKTKLKEADAEVKATKDSKEKNEKDVEAAKVAVQAKPEPVTPKAKERTKPTVPETPMKAAKNAHEKAEKDTKSLDLVSAEEQAPSVEEKPVEKGIAGEPPNMDPFNMRPSVGTWLLIVPKNANDHDEEDDEGANDGCEDGDEMNALERVGSWLGFPSRRNSESSNAGANNKGNEDAAGTQPGALQFLGSFFSSK